MPRITKEEAEDAIMSRFIPAYKKKYGIQLVEIVHRDKPDYQVYDPINNQYIGIEITGVYQDEEEAQIQYWVVEDWKQVTGSIENYLGAINNGIAKKVEKAQKYKYKGPISLAIWIGSLVFTEKRDVEFIRRCIIIPENNYARIWFIIQNQDNQSDELYCTTRFLS